MEGANIHWGALLKPEYAWRILGLVITWVLIWFLVRYLSRVLERLDERIKGVDTASWFTVTSDFRRSIVEEFERRGLELAMPVYKSYSVTVNA